MTIEIRAAELNRRQLAVFWVLCLLMFITSMGLILFNGVRDANSFTAMVETERIGHATLEALLRQIKERDEKAMLSEREMYRAKIDSILAEHSRQLMEIEDILRDHARNKK